MPESHPGIQFVSRRKPRRRSSGPSESRTAAAIGAGFHRQGARSGPAPYQITGHPEKFVEGERHGQMVDRRGTGDKARAQARAQGSAVQAAVLRLITGTPVGQGLTQAKTAYIWDRLAPLFGKSGKGPAVNFVPTRSVGSAPFGGREVKLHPGLRIGFLPGIELLGKKGRRTADYATDVLAHELAHTQQGATPGYYATREGKAMTEGGAVAFENAIASYLGATPTPRPRSDPYAAYLREFLRKRGTKGALHDQFPGAP